MAKLTTKQAAQVMAAKIDSLTKLAKMPVGNVGHWMGKVLGGGEGTEIANAVRGALGDAAVHPMTAAGSNATGRAIVDSLRAHGVEALRNQQANAPLSQVLSERMPQDIVGRRAAGGAIVGGTGGAMIDTSTDDTNMLGVTHHRPMTFSDRMSNVGAGALTGALFGMGSKAMSMRPAAIDQIIESGGRGLTEKQVLDTLKSRLPASDLNRVYESVRNEIAGAGHLHDTAWLDPVTKTVKPTDAARNAANAIRHFDRFGVGTGAAAPNSPAGLLDLAVGRMPLVGRLSMSRPMNASYEDLLASMGKLNPVEADLAKNYGLDRIGRLRDTGAFVPGKGLGVLQGQGGVNAMLEEMSMLSRAAHRTDLTPEESDVIHKIFKGMDESAKARANAMSQSVEGRAVAGAKAHPVLSGVGVGAGMAGGAALGAPFGPVGAGIGAGLGGLAAIPTWLATLGKRVN